MKKSFYLYLGERKICLSFFALIFLITVYLLGIILSLFLIIDFQDKLFSPFVFSFNSQKLFMILSHSAIYFFITPIILLLCSTSFFGFAFVPLIVFIKSFFTGISVLILFTEYSFLKVIFLHIPIISVEIMLIIIFSSLAISNSFLVKNSADNKVYLKCFNQAFIMFVMMSVLVVVKTLVFYLV